MQRKTEENEYSTMTTPINHDGHSTVSPQNPSLNPTNNSTFVENPNDYDHETHRNHHQNITTNVVESPNDHDQDTHNHLQITTNNVATHVIDDNVASDNVNVNNNMVGLTKEEWPFEYPPGYKFAPEDGELIVYYLLRKINNLNLPHNKIKDVDLYDTTPDKVTAEHEPVGDSEWYFFTPRNRKYRNGKRPNRAAAGTGYWKATGADKPITFNNQLVGHKKALVFYHGKAPKGDKTDWIMHEFKVLETTERQRLDADDMRLDDFVLCRIYNKGRNGKTDIDNEQPKSEVDEPNSNSDDNDEGDAQPKIVAEDKKTPPSSPLPSLFPNIEFYEDEEFNVDKFFRDEPFFSSYNIKDSGDSMFNYLPPNHPHPCMRCHRGAYSCFCDFQHEVKPFFSNPVTLIDNKSMGSMMQESFLLPFELINNVSAFQTNLNGLPMPLISSSGNNARVPSQKSENVGGNTSGGDAPGHRPFKKQKHV